MWDLDWGLPSVIILDRDARFIAGFFHAVFSGLNVAFYTTAAYHPQADGQSERTNQIIEIAIRFFVTTNPDLEWRDGLEHIQFTMNCSKNKTNDASPNKYITGLNLRDPLDLLTTVSKQDFAILCLQFREAA
jgi:hypothetical protein